MTGMTVGRVGDSGTFAVPNEKQLAYDAYRSNIEAFLFATAVKKKVLCNQEVYPFPTSYVRSIPIPVPATVIHFKSAPPAQIMAKILEEGQTMGMESLLRRMGSPT